MPLFHYAGYPPYLAAAAAEMGMPGAAVSAGRQPALTKIDGLICQMIPLSLADQAEVFSHVVAHRDTLAVAHAAAEKIVAAVAAGLDLPAPEPVGVVAPPKKVRSK